MLSPFVQSLAQVLFHKARIVELLLEHLRVKDSLALRPLLQYVSLLVLFGGRENLFVSFSNLYCAQFDRDTGARPKATFFTFFPRHFADTGRPYYRSNPDMLEAVFTTLGYLFKFLQRHLIEDLESLFGVWLSSPQYTYRSCANTSHKLLHSPLGAS